MNQPSFQAPATMQLLFSRNPLFQSLLALMALGLSFCNAQKPVSTAVGVQTSLDYALEHPSRVITFAVEDLKEISALSPTDEKGIFLAISDEKGEFFFINADNGKITQRVLFREKGDFEGAEMVGQALWGLKSDGKLFEVQNWKQGEPLVIEFETPLKKKDDVEGLGYDAGGNVLLLACKGDPDSAYLRHIYTFDLKTKTMDEKPLYSIDPKIINRLVPYLETEKQDYFSPSALAVNPLDGNVYVISTALKRLVILNKDSKKIQFAVRLDKTLLPQPEGIAFDPEGNLYISSEGKKDNGRLLRFDYHKK